MVATAKSFLEALERNKWRSKDVKDQENGNTVVVCGVTGKTVQVDFQFFFDKNEHTVAIRIFNLFLTPVDKWMQVMEQINKCNAAFRFVKFVINADNWVSVQSDALINAEKGGDICMELMLLIMKIIDDAYPKFMHEIWA